MGGIRERSGRNRPVEKENLQCVKRRTMHHSASKMEHGRHIPMPAMPSIVRVMPERRAKIRSMFRRRVLTVVAERTRDMDRRADLAAMFATDAIEGRLEHGLGKLSQSHPEVVWAFTLQTGHNWLTLLVACNVAHILFSLFEPPQAPLPFLGGGRGGADDVGATSAVPAALTAAFWLALRVAELFFCGVYLADAWLKVQYMGVADYLSKPWQQLYLGVALALTLDAASFGQLRVARALRPAICCLRVRSVRRFFTVVRDMAPGFVQVCVPLAFLILLSSSFAAMAFGSLVPELNSPGGAAYAIWILLASTDNYEDLLPPLVWGHGGYVAFFFLVLLVGNVFLLSLLLGVTFDVFIEHTAAQVKSERLKELKGLTVAFTTLDPEGTGKVPLVMWDKFLGRLRPALKPSERFLYYEIITGFLGEVDIISFMDLHQVLKYTVVGGQSKAAPQGMTLAARAFATAGKLAPLNCLWRFVAAVVILDAALLPYLVPTLVADGDTTMALADANAAMVPLRFGNSSKGAAAGGGSASDGGALWALSSLLLGLLPASVETLAVSRDAAAAFCSGVLFADLVVRAVSGPGQTVFAAAAGWFRSLSTHEQVAFSAVALHAPVARCRRRGSRRCCFRCHCRRHGARRRRTARRGRRTCCGWRAAGGW
ncbi:unnamed protein product [Phaeothamnion confervicola]